MSGYSGTPLVKKLGFREDHVLFVYSPPREYFDWVNPLPPSIQVKTRLAGEFDALHLFVESNEDFQSIFRKAKTKLKRDGMIWVSWPKKSSGVETDLDENIIRDFGLAEGLVDVKVCAVSDVWSGLKFVRRLKDR
jgi:hypothetical protein